MGDVILDFCSSLFIFIAISCQNFRVGWVEDGYIYQVAVKINPPETQQCSYSEKSNRINKSLW